MTRNGWLSIKAIAGMHLVLSMTGIAVFLLGCEVPPSPTASDATSSVTMSSEKTATEDYGIKATQVMVSDANTGQPGPEKTEVVVSAPVDQVPTPKPQAIGLTPTLQESVQPVVAAVDLADQEEPNELTITHPEGVVSPANTVVEAIKADIVASPDAKAYVVDRVCDFGEITPLDRPKGIYQIKNIGTDILHITNVKVCCGAMHELSSNELQPGETSVLTVAYIANQIGPFEKYLNVFTNDANNLDIKLTIKGKVVRRLAWTPDRFKLFLDKENGGCLPIKITSIDGKPFSLSSFSATEDCLIADVDPNKVATEFVLSPKVDLEKLSTLKIPKGIVRIRHTHPGCDTVTLNYDLFKRYAYTPKRFLVLNADQRKTRTQRLNIMDNYADSVNLQKGNENKPSMFSIESVECEKGSAVLKSTKQITDGFQLTFEITPPDPAGQRLFQDLITIKLSTGDEIQVPVNGIYSVTALSVPDQEQ